MRKLTAIVFICTAAAMLFAPQMAYSAPEWACGFKDVRAGRVGTTVWAYCFGYDDEKILIKKRVILGDGVTAQMEADTRSWVLTGQPDLMAREASEALWNSRRAAAARAAMEDAITAERVAGTFPKPRLWRVAPNPSSTTTPPTRPMWDAMGIKTVDERAIVGTWCNCTARVSKGTQTLCPLRQLGDIAPTTNVTACVRQ